MKKREIIFILSSTFVVVVAWIIFSIHHNRVTSTIPDALSIKIAPIEKSFDIATIESLKARERIAPISALQPTAEPTREPTLQPTPTAQATGSALLSPTPATQGGTPTP